MLYMLYSNMIGEIGMDNLIASPSLAKAYLNTALEYGKLANFLEGFGLFGLHVKDPYGNDVFSAMHVMEAIYNKHRSDQSLKLDELTANTIAQELERTRYEENILNLMEDILYQVNAQKKGTAAFNLDCVDLLNKLKENIKRNEPFYRYPHRLKDGSMSNTWAKLEDYNKRMYQETGTKIL